MGFKSLPQTTSHRSSVITPRELTRLRKSIPVHAYLSIAHTIIVKGYFPKTDLLGNLVDNDGRLTDNPVPDTYMQEQFHKGKLVGKVEVECKVPEKTRVALMTEMINKLIPTATNIPIEDALIETSDSVREVEATLSKLSDEELNHLQSQLITDARVVEEWTDE